MAIEKGHSPELPTPQRETREDVEDILKSTEEVLAILGVEEELSFDEAMQDEENFAMLIGMFDLWSGEIEDMEIIEQIFTRAVTLTPENAAYFTEGPYDDMIEALGDEEMVMRIVQAAKEA